MRVSQQDREERLAWAAAVCGVEWKEHPFPAGEGVFVHVEPLEKSGAYCAQDLERYVVLRVVEFANGYRLHSKHEAASFQYAKGLYVRNVAVRVASGLTQFIALDCFGFELERTVECIFGPLSKIDLRKDLKRNGINPDGDDIVWV